MSLNAFIGISLISLSLLVLLMLLNFRLKALDMAAGIKSYDRIDRVVAPVCGVLVIVGLIVVAFTVSFSPATQGLQTDRSGPAKPAAEL